MIFSLDKESNKEFYKIMDSCRALSNSFFELNKDILNLKIPDFFIFLVLLKRTRKNLRNIQQRFGSLQNEFIKWFEYASYCQSYPQFDMKGIDKELWNVAFLHFSNLIQRAIESLEGHVESSASNIRSIESVIDNKLNFIIAITGWIVTFAGLIVSLIALKVSL